MDTAGPTIGAVIAPAHAVTGDDAHDDGEESFADATSVGGDAASGAPDGERQGKQARRRTRRNGNSHRSGARRFQVDVPLRTLLVMLIVIVAGFGLTVSSVAVYSIMRDVSYERVDDDLRGAMTGWAQNSDLFSANAAARPPSDFCVIKVFPDGTVQVFNDRGSTPEVKDLVIGSQPQNVGSVDDALNSSQWRAMATEGDATITVVAKNLDRENNVLRGLALIQAFISIVVLAIIAVMATALIRRALRPLSVVERTAAQIAKGDVDKRVPEWPLNTEVGQLSAALNVMLSRLQESIVEAQAKEQQMRRFVGDASHELRTPLTSLRGYTELYRSGATKDIDLVLNKVEDESHRMSLLVEDLLALTRAEGSRLDMRPIDVLEVALAAASTARAAHPGRTVEVMNKASSLPVIKGDAERLHQVLLNLIVNGLRHGGEDATIKVKLRRDSKDVLIDVADNGKGMPPDVAAHIFERFYREDTSRTRGTGGSGLGLAIVKSIVEQHDGSVTVSSAVGEGSTFTVRIPRFEEYEEHPSTSEHS